jgi:two-component system, NarL family, response regulator DesR
MSGPLRLLLVEDNEMFRDALGLLLGLRSDVEVIATVGDGDAAVEACRAHVPDVVLMDYRMPGLEGAEAVAAVREACPAATVVCLTASVGAEEEEELVAAGAAACLRKDQELESIIAAIHAAASGSTEELRAADG